jgi:hypothetical protein
LRREHLRRLAIRDLVDRFFDGSEDALIEYLRTGDAAPVSAPRSNDEVHLDAALL